MRRRYEAALFPAFETVLQQDVQEFHPYVFQIFAQLIELQSSPLPAIYLQVRPAPRLPPCQQCCPPPAWTCTASVQFSPAARGSDEPRAGRASSMRFLCVGNTAQVVQTGSIILFISACSPLHCNGTES